MSLAPPQQHGDDVQGEVVDDLAASVAWPQGFVGDCVQDVRQQVGGERGEHCLAVDDEAEKKQFDVSLGRRRIRQPFAE